MSEHFNKLTPAEDERLALLMEECGEVIQVIGKIMRHGLESHHPEGGPSNRELLEKEVGDVEYAVSLLVANGDVGSLAISQSRERKVANAPKYLHHQEFTSTRPCGCPESSRHRP